MTVAGGIPKIPSIFNYLRASFQPVSSFRAPAELAMWFYVQELPDWHSAV